MPIKTTPSLQDSLSQFSTEFVYESETFKKFFEYYLSYVKENNLFEPIDKIDPDFVDDMFVDNLKRKFLRDIPGTNAIKALSNDDIKNIAKNMIKINKNKGTNNSIQYLFKMLFESEAFIENGILGSYQVYKPYEVVVEEIGSNLLPIPNNYTSFNLFSKQDFVVTDSDVTGLCETVYWDEDTTKFWVDNLTGELKEGDILYFASYRKYARVLEFRPLELDGWLGQATRWKTFDDMYTQYEYNTKLYTIYREYLLGYEVFNRLDQYGNPIAAPSFAKQSFIANDGGFLSCTLMQGSDLVSSQETTTIQEAINATNLIGVGTITDDFILTFNGFGTGIFTYEFSFDWDGDTYSATFQFFVQDGIVYKLLVNGDERQIGTVSVLTYRISAADIQLDGTVLIDPMILQDRLVRVGRFTYIIYTDINRSVYLDILRNTVIPAGYGIVSVFGAFIDGLSRAAKIYVEQNTLKTPSVRIRYTPEEVQAGDTQSTSRNHKIISNLSLCEYKYLKGYDFYKNKFDSFGYSNLDLSTFAHITIGEAIAYENEYLADNKQPNWYIDNKFAMPAIITVN